MRTVQNRRRSLFPVSRGKRIVSVVLAVLIAVSMLLIAVPVVSAKNDLKTFENMETVYIDTSGISNFSEGNAGVNIWTYYPDNPEWNRQNNKLDSACMADVNSSSHGKNLAKLDAVRLSDTLWKVDIPGDNKLDGGDDRDYGDKALRVLRVNFSSNGGEIWNYTQKIDAGEGRVNGGKPDMIRLTGWNGSEMNYEWAYSAPTSGGTSNSYIAKVSEGILNAAAGDTPTVYPITAKFFDYYTDDEIRYGWRNIKQDTTRKDWEPYQYFNSVLAQQAEADSVNKPLYFGNFYDKDDGYLGVGRSSLYNFKNQPNNSNRLGGYSKSVTGLADNNLSNGSFCYKGGSISPLFNEAWLTNNGVATIVTTDAFPMRIDRSTGVNYYEYDSTDAKDVAYITGSGSNMTINYGSGAAVGIKDAESHYGGTSDGYGFLPFDEPGSEGKDFGFGMRVDVEFNVAEDGYLYADGDKSHSHPIEQVFRFSGDDDVWVYIDNRLVLDIGGDHKIAKGEINFHSLTATVSTGTVGDATGGNTNFSSWFKNNDSSKKHILTMFYMERGLSESNLKFGFNFSPVNNEFVTDKSVVANGLNSGLASITDELENIDTFTFQHNENSNPSGGKEYSHSAEGKKTTPKSGTYSLKNGESAGFVNQFEEGSAFDVTESCDNAVFSYDTTYTIEDLDVALKGGDGFIASGTGTKAEFDFITKDQTSPLNATRIGLHFVNEMVTGTADISKIVVDENGHELSGNKVEFPAVVSLSFDKGRTYDTYPLEYTVFENNAREVKTMGSDGKVVLKEGRSLRIFNLPAGTYIKVEEAFKQGYSVSYSGDSNVITVVPRGVSLTVTNTRAGQTVKTRIGAEKLLDDDPYSGNLFGFRIKGMNAQISDRDVDTSSVNLVKTDVRNGSFSQEFTYTAPGVYRYMLSEESFSPSDDSDLFSSDILSLSKQYLVVVDVVDDGEKLTASAPVYYDYDQAARGGDVDASDFTTDKRASKVAFENVTRYGSITVDKSNQEDEKVQDTEFAVYRIDTDKSVDEIKNSMSYEDVTSLEPVQSGKTDADGLVRLQDLLIYEEGYTDTTQSLPKRQIYAIAEIDSGSGYHPNKHMEFFEFPTYDKETQEYKYDYVFEYVNGRLRNPMTSGRGMSAFRITGLVIVAVMALFAALYMIYIKKPLKTKKAVHYGCSYKYLRRGK